MSLTFVERHSLFSTYRREDGSLAYLAHAETQMDEFGNVVPLMRYLFDFDAALILQFWDEMFRPEEVENWRTSHRVRRSAVITAFEPFLDFLRATLTYPDEADDVAWCTSCFTIAPTEDGSNIQGGDFACDSCISSNYTCCHDCDDYVLYDDASITLSDYSVCATCRDRNYSFCDDCDGYYNNDDGEEHTHDMSMSCCVSPATDFTIRNDGNEPLANDTRITVILPAGEIDPEGVNRIRTFLLNLQYDGVAPRTAAAAADIALQLGTKVQTKAGNFTKRLSRELYKQLLFKISPEVLSEIGNIASAHSGGADFAIEVTRLLNGTASQFGNGSSCWWDSYGRSRCALKTNGGFALRSFDRRNDVTGRSWVMPLKETNTPQFRNGKPGAPGLMPTFDTMTPAAFAVFNGYGNLGGYYAARILAHMAGVTYRKVEFRCDPMYVNGGSGYLVASEVIAQQYTDSHLRLEVPEHANLYNVESERGRIHVA